MPSSHSGCILGSPRELLSVTTQDQLRHDLQGASQASVVFKAIQVIPTCSPGQEPSIEQGYSKPEPRSAREMKIVLKIVFQQDCPGACTTLKFEKRCSNPFPRPHLAIGSSNIKWTGTYGFAAGSEIGCGEKTKFNHFRKWFFKIPKRQEE